MVGLRRDDPKLKPSASRRFSKRCLSRNEHPGTTFGAGREVQQVRVAPAGEFSLLNGAPGRHWIPSHLAQGRPIGRSARQRASRFLADMVEATRSRGEDRLSVDFTCCERGAKDGDHRFMHQAGSTGLRLYAFRSRGFISRFCD